LREKIFNLTIPTHYRGKTTSGLIGPVSIKFFSIGYWRNAASGVRSGIGRAVCEKHWKNTGWTGTHS
jgi:hypothetical protein